MILVDAHAVGCVGTIENPTVDASQPDASDDGSAPVDGGLPATTQTETPDDLPCAVADILTRECVSCHGPTLASGGVDVTHVEAMDALSPDYASVTVAERCLVRMQSATLPMPPSGPSPTSAEVATLRAWIDAGTPTRASDDASCDTSGGTDPIVPTTTPPPTGSTDPLNASPTCTSATLVARTGDDGVTGDADMNPGVACLACHKSKRVGGTLYPTGHEPDLCNGIGDGAQVIIADASGATYTLPVAASGNFQLKGVAGATSLKMPYTAKVVYNGKTRAMLSAQYDADCNACHSASGTQGAPGRVTLPE